MHKIQLTVFLNSNRDKANIQSVQKVLINGASGSVFASGGLTIGKFIQRFRIRRALQTTKIIILCGVQRFEPLLMIGDNDDKSLA